MLGKRRSEVGRVTYRPVLGSCPKPYAQGETVKIIYYGKDTHERFFLLWRSDIAVLKPRDPILTLLAEPCWSRFCFS